MNIESDKPLVGIYVEMYCSLRSTGNNWERNQNDLWIAALAHAAGARLLTTDFKLRPLAPKFLAIEAYHFETGALTVIE